MRVLAAALLVLSLLTASASAQGFVVEGLPLISGFGGRVFDLNDAGVSVGHGLSPTLQQHALRWLDTGVADLSPGNPLAEAHGIAAGGVAFGYARNPAGQTEAARFAGGSLQFLGHLPGHLGSFAQDGNDAGLVAGWSVTAVGDPVATVWSVGGPQAIAGTQSWAFAVSEVGDVAGHRWVGVEKQGFRWRAGEFTLLPDLGLGHVSAVGISPQGRIAGSAASPADGKLHGVVWDLALEPLDLGLFLGTFSTAAADCNDQGVAVGGALNDEGEVFRALVWRGAGAEDLNQWIPPGSGWTLLDARAVNSRGEIVGQGLFGGSLAPRPFRLRPDCDGDGLPDTVEVAAGTAADSNGDGLDDSCQHCQVDLGSGGPGTLRLSVCGDPLTELGQAATVRVAGGAPGMQVWIVVGTPGVPTPLLGGTLVPSPPLSLLAPVTLGEQGSIEFAIQAPSALSADVVAQALALPGAEVLFSNGVLLEFGPR